MKISELFDLRETVSIVTGGTGHLGKSMAEALAEAGSEVYITGTTETKCKKVVKDFQKNGFDNVKSVVMDINSSNSIKKAFKSVASSSGKITTLVNNASYLPVGQFENISEKDWQSGIEGILNGVFRCTKEVLPFLKKNDWSSIINISSIYGEVSPDPSIYGDSGYNSPPHYGAGKAGIIQLTKYMACHFAKDGIRVNAISPGPFPNKEVQKKQEIYSKFEKENSFR